MKVKKSTFLIIGLAGFTTWDIAWPLVLILVGVAILASIFLRCKWTTCSSKQGD
jgi:hypothetical protein